MKKIILSLSLVLCCFVFHSCDDEKNYSSEERTDNYPPDTSLAGSICMINYHFQAEAAYDGIELVNPSKNSFLSISKITDTTVGFYCKSEWEQEVFLIDIPEVDLSGKTYNVTFDHTSNDATITRNGFTYTPAAVTIRGWIKRKSYSDRRVTDKISRNIPIPEYTCEIDIDCSVDNKPFTLKIKEVD